MARVFVGHDWAEDHHDVFVEDASGKRLASARLPEGVEGIARFHELVASHVDEPGEVLVASETDRGLFVGALVAAGYEVIAVNPLSTSRYRERHSTSGAKSDPGDARVLAELARSDGHNHRRVAGDSELAEAVKVLARAHQSLVWTRQRQTNQLRSTLREFYPAAVEAFPELAAPEALAVLATAPTPALGRGLSRSRIAAVIRRAGRKRRVEERAEEIQAALRAEYLEAQPLVASAMGAAAAALTRVIAECNRQITELEEQLSEHFEQHPDAKIIRSLPGLGMVLGARVLGEFGDDPNRYSDAKCRRNYAGTSPITKASGKHRVVLARYARNRRLADACHLWAFAAITASPGARAFYDERRASGDTHHRALRALSNRLVGILHGCLSHGTLYDEVIAWEHRQPAAA
ncbi:MAG TPA: IS110 family transposase [Acidimicrobiales bacterium]|nr:IS110 family transposase [Acidimicrobiales bacterium]